MSRDEIRADLHEVTTWAGEALTNTIDVARLVFSAPFPLLMLALVATAIVVVAVTERH